MTPMHARRPAPTFFKTPAAFRAWLAKNHGKATELMIGFYRKDSGRGGMTYHQALDEALCYGWIDGVRKSHDAESFAQRFTPRKPKSYWSRVNRGKAEALIAAGRMTPPGFAAWERRDEGGVDAYSSEARPSRFPVPIERTFKSDKAAWTFFNKQPEGYRRVMYHWIASARREATRDARLAILMTCSAEAKRVDLLDPRGTRKR